MHVYLETDRLVLRRFVESDVDNLAELDSDPEVMRFLTGGRPTPRERIRDEVLPRRIAEYQRFPRLGLWAAISRSSGEFEGWFALAPPKGADADRGADEAELGYRLRRAAWGRGLATEGSQALVRKAFAELGLRRVWAETMAVNTRSRGVMEKAGLRHVRTFHLDWDDPIEGVEHGEVEYELRREDWAAPQ